MITGDLVHMIDLLPSQELYEVECYISDLKKARRKEEAKNLAEELNAILIKIYEAGFSEITIEQVSDMVDIVLWNGTKTIEIN